VTWERGKTPFDLSNMRLDSRGAKLGFRHFFHFNFLFSLSSRGRGEHFLLGRHDFKLLAKHGGVFKWKITFPT
jgi:hypothetical protein